jgi:competence protein ComEC
MFSFMDFLSNLRPSEQLRGGLLCFLFGIFLSIGSYFPFFALMGFLFIVMTVFLKKRGFIFLGIIFLAASWSAWRSEFDFRNDVLVSRGGQEISLIGKIRTPPDVREDSVRAFVESDQGNFLLILPHMEMIYYGDRVSLHGKITKPRSFADFDYLRYLRRWGAQTIIKNPEQFTILSSGGGNTIVRWAQTVRNFFEKNVRRALPEPHATIAVGVLLGVKSSLPEWTQNDFKNSGLQHLLVVSGSNVAIVVSLTAFLLARFGRWAVFWGSLFSLLFFVLLVGMDAPVLRAAVMGGVVGVAAALGRFSDARTLILFSAAFIGLLQPAIVRDDVGFHLSFLATVGIILGTPILLDYFARISSKKWWTVLSLILSVSLAAQIAVLPVLGRSFGVFPVSGVIANIFAEPLVPIAMGAGAITAVLGWLPLFIVRMIALPAFLAIEGLLFVAYIFGQIPPLVIPLWITNFSALCIGGFMVWGLLSRSFAERWLVRHEK